MSILEVRQLCKSYEKFQLKDVSFELEPGTINGFIGRNGAGKTTTMKSLLNLVHPDSGEIRFWGRAFTEAELEIKRKIGFVSGGVNYYPTKKIKTITGVSRRFYTDWDEDAYKKYLAMFQLDEEKKPCELSEGMKVKYSLALALSHNAKLLILDEPTSGLDPVSRDDLLDVFLGLVDGGDICILFSTHITTDLEKCADNIIYIKNGRIIESGALDAFTAAYRAVKPDGAQAENWRELGLIGCKKEKNSYSALVRADALPEGMESAPADLETIMVHMERE